MPSITPAQRRGMIHTLSFHPPKPPHALPCTAVGSSSPSRRGENQWESSRRQSTHANMSPLAASAVVTRPNPIFSFSSRVATVRCTAAEYRESRPARPREEGSVAVGRGPIQMRPIRPPARPMASLSELVSATSSSASSEGLPRGRRPRNALARLEFSSSAKYCTSKPARTSGATRRCGTVSNMSRLRWPSCSSATRPALPAPTSSAPTLPSLPALPPPGAVGG
mmetsp:Transcript_14778/g.49111  ORF Transcript_14778/g.49111 Transcript_14778/m.49111 type:complete len:224 (+) Transcript_14778:499-1170(+)